MASQKTVLESIAFALIILYLVFEVPILLYVSAGILFLTIIESRWIFWFAGMWVAVVSFIGTKIFQLVLLVLYFAFITPYSIVARHFMGKKKFTTWGSGAESTFVSRTDEFHSQSFEQPW